MYGGNCFFLKQGRLEGRFLPKIVLNLSFSYEDNHRLFTNFRPQTSCILIRNVVFLNGATNEFLQAEDDFSNLLYYGESMYIIRHLQKGRIFLYGDNVAVYQLSVEKL